MQDKPEFVSYEKKADSTGWMDGCAKKEKKMTPSEKRRKKAQQQTSERKGGDTSPQ